MKNKIITVKGKGTSRQAPDQIQLALDLQTLVAEYSRTFEMANEKVSRLQAELAKVGFTKDQLKTTDFNVTARYESYQEKNGEWRQRFVGYQLTQRFLLAFSLDMEKLGKVIYAIDASASEPQLSVNFTVSDPAAMEAEMLQSAAEDAQRKAEILAQATGQQLGDLLGIDYNWGEVVFQSETQIGGLNLMRASEIALPDLTPEDVEVGDTVTFNWQLK